MVNVAFYAQFNAIQLRFPKCDIVIVMGGQNANVSLDNPLLGYVMGKHGLGDRNDNVRKFVGFFKFHRLVAQCSITEPAWISIDQFAIDNRFWSCLLNVRNLIGTEISLERDPPYVLLRDASATSRRVKKLWSLQVQYRPLLWSSCLPIVEVLSC